MTTILTRAAAGRKLTYDEMDTNLTNLNDDKAETSVTDSLATQVGTNASAIAAIQSELPALAVSSDLAASTGATLIGTSSGPLSQFLGRSQSRFGRVAAADLPRFMDTIRGYRQDLQAYINVVGFGSSVGVGATLPDPSTQAPVAWFKSQLKALFDPGNLYNIRVSNQSVNGSTVSDFPTAWAAMLSAGYTTPGIAVFAYGMNDQGPAIYNAGQTFPGFYTAMRNAVITAKKAGWDVVIMTTPHASIVLNPSYWSMPVGVPQSYPTTVAANVAPEQMQPPASASTITADFLGEGVPISISHRALRINQAMRAVAKEFGTALIDVERYWFEALQKYQISTGSAGGAEGVLFNSGEVLHPNLTGHQESYQRGITEFLTAFSKQTSQHNIDPHLNGYYGINSRGSLPAAVLDVRAPYADTTSKPVSVSVPIGTPDGNGVPADVEMFFIDTTNGDIVQGNSWRTHTNRQTSGLIASIERSGSSYGVNFTERILGDINNSTNLSIALPDNSVGELWVQGEQSGIGTSPHAKWYRWFTKSGTLTLQANGSDIGSATITVAASGLNAVVTPIASNTNLQVHWKKLSP